MRVASSPSVMVECFWSTGRRTGSSRATCWASRFHPRYVLRRRCSMDESSCITSRCLFKYCYLNSHPHISALAPINRTQLHGGSCAVRCLLLSWPVPVKTGKWNLYFCFSPNWLYFQQGWCSVWWIYAHLLSWNDFKLVSFSPFLHRFFFVFFFRIFHWLAGFFYRPLRMNVLAAEWTLDTVTLCWKCQRAAWFALHGEATAGSTDQGSPTCYVVRITIRPQHLTTISGPVTACLVILCFIKVNKMHCESDWLRINDNKKKGRNLRRDSVL